MSLYPDQRLLWPAQVRKKSSPSVHLLSVSWKVRRDSYHIHRRIPHRYLHGQLALPVLYVCDRLRSDRDPALPLPDFHPLIYSRPPRFRCGKRRRSYQHPRSPWSLRPFLLPPWLDLWIKVHRSAHRQVHLYQKRLRQLCLYPLFPIQHSHWPRTHQMRLWSAVVPHLSLLPPWIPNPHCRQPLPEDHPRTPPHCSTYLQVLWNGNQIRGFRVWSHRIPYSLTYGFLPPASQKQSGSVFPWKNHRHQSPACQDFSLSAPGSRCWSSQILPLLSLHHPPPS